MGGWEAKDTGGERKGEKDFELSFEVLLILKR